METPELLYLPVQTWTIEGVERQAAVYVPAVLDKPVKSPVLIAFHGHAGTGPGFARAKHFETNWFGAIIIYPTGLIGGGRGSTETGWQRNIGEVNEVTGIKDQDVKFFDALIATWPDRNVYLHGFSNGGELVYDVLWVIRSDKIKGMANASSILNTVEGKTHVPVMHIAGTNDPVVGFDNQKAKTITIAEYNQAMTISGVAWSTGLEADGITAIKWSSKIKCPVIFIQHNEGHNYPDSISSLIVKFLRNYDRKGT